MLTLLWTEQLCETVMFEKGKCLMAVEMIEQSVKMQKPRTDSGVQILINIRSFIALLPLRNHGIRYSLIDSEITIKLPVIFNLNLEACKIYHRSNLAIQNLE